MTRVTKTVSTRISEQDHKKMMKIIKEKDTSMAILLRYALKQFLEEK